MQCPYLGICRELHKANLDLHDDAQKEPEPKPISSPTGKRKLSAANPFAKKPKAAARSTL